MKLSFMLQNQEKMIVKKLDSKVQQLLMANIKFIGTLLSNILGSQILECHKY